MPTKSDLTFDELLKAGLQTPPKPAQPPKTQRKRGAEKRGKPVKSGA